MRSSRLIFCSNAQTETCKRGPLRVSWRNQRDCFCRHCSRFTTQLLASLPLLLVLLFPTVESHTTMACPSMILIASGTVATSVGDEFWWLVMEMKGKSNIHLQSNGRNPSLVPHKGICHVSHWEQVVGASLGVYRMLNLCAWKKKCVLQKKQLWQYFERCLFCLPLQFSLLKLKICKPLALSARKIGNCGSKLVEII